MLGALAMAFAACDEPAPTVPPVQQNPQGPILENATLSGQAQGAFANNGTVNLEDYVNNPNVLVATVGSIDGMPEGGKIVTRMQISAVPDYSDPKRTFLLDMDLNGNDATVNAYTLNDDHVYMFGKAPKPKTVYYRVLGFINLNGTDYRMGGENYYVAEGTYQEICMDLGFVIEDSYYFLSNATTWSLTEGTPYKFNHNDDVSVYDDPVFTYIVETTAPDCYWKIAPQSAVESGDWAQVLGVEVNGSTDLEGKLIAGSDGAGRFAEVGKYQIIINMESSTYKIKPVLFPDMLSTPGGANGWNPAGASWMRISKGEEGRYSEAILASGELKFTDPMAPWTAKVTWGASKDGVAGTLADDIDGCDNIKVDGNGAYWAYVDLNTLTYILTPITSVGVVGNLNGWSIEGYDELTPNEDFSVWTGTVNFDGGEWKIAFNHSWDYNYGGTLEEPWFDAGNFGSTAGEATVTLDLTGNLPVITVK